VSGEGDPRFDLRMRSRLPPLRAPSYAPGTLLRVSPIIPPPLRRERGRETTAWQPRAVVLPPPVADYDDAADVQTLPSQLDHEPEVTT
jgi:hypothetical protein